MARPVEIKERDDRYEVDLSDDEVSRFYVDYQFSIQFLETGLLIAVEYPFIFSTPSGDFSLDPATPSGLGPVFALLGKSGTIVHAYKSGVLELTFEDGYRLRVEPDGRHEPWHLVAPNRVRIVAMPSGELAIWSAVEEPDDSGDAR